MATPENEIGIVIDGSIGKIQKEKQTCYIDAAYCYVDPRVRKSAPTIPTIGPITGHISQSSTNTLLNTYVAKYGARTGFTQGIVIDIHYSWKHTGDPQKTTFLDQMLVRPIDPYKVFNDRGDSGAPVITMGNEKRITAGLAAGLVMGMNTNQNTGVINPMWMILSALNLRLLPQPPQEYEND